MNLINGIYLISLMNLFVHYLNPLLVNELTRNYRIKNFFPFNIMAIIQNTLT